MYYFLNDNMQFSKSGIEQAEINRLTLFKKHHVAAKIVTRVFAMNLHDVLEGANIADADFVNLFDFFCGSQSVKRQGLIWPTLKCQPMLSKPGRIIRFKSWNVVS